MKFTKMHGIGNDYVYVNCFKETVEHPSEMAIKVSDRHFGIGSDGLILIKPSEVADGKMEMYNADGSQGAMCGNGIRCVAKYMYDYGITDKTSISVETKSGIKYLDLTIKDGKVDTVKVNMGTPILKAVDIPVRSEKEKVIDESVMVDGKEWKITCVSMGNPHAVVFVDDVDSLDLPVVGPAFEHHPWFPSRTNTEFVQLMDAGHVRMRVWERGAGETLACGTGACAVAVACHLTGSTGREVAVQLRGGTLDIRWDERTGHVLMTGPARTVFSGEYSPAQGQED